MPIFTTFSIFLPECPTLTPLLISSEIVLILDKVFFIGAAPHYTDEVFDYIELKLQERYYN